MSLSPVRPLAIVIAATGLCMCALTAFAAPAGAQAVPSPAPSPTASTQANPAQRNPEVPAQGPDKNSYGVFGDFGGGRESLENDGVSFHGRYGGEFAATSNTGSAAGGLSGGTGYASEFQIGADIDFAKVRHSKKGGTLHFIGTERWGSSISSNIIGNIASVQEIYGAGLTTRLTELDYEQPIADGKVNVKFGRVIMQSDFAAASTYWGGNLWCNFQSNAICGTPVAVPNNSGYGYYPDSEWGVRVKAQPSTSFYVESGVYQVNPLYGQRFQGFNFSTSADTGVDIPFETGVTMRNAAGSPTGNVRVGGYYDTSDVLGAESYISRFVPGTNAALGLVPSTRYRGRDGFWVLADHLLGGSSEKDKTGTALFLAYEFGDPQTALISNFVDGGIVRHGTFANRPDDSIALGFAYTDVNPRLRNFERFVQSLGIGAPITNQEKMVELNYDIQLDRAIILRPGLQYVINPSGESNTIYANSYPGLRNALVFGVTTNISF